jgi:hypothetical protein
MLLRGYQLKFQVRGSLACRANASRRGGPAYHAFDIHSAHPDLRQLGASMKDRVWARSGNRVTKAIWRSVPHNEPVHWAETSAVGGC